MGTTKLEVIDGTGVGAIGTGGWSVERSSGRAVGVALVPAGDAGALVGGGAQRDQRGMVSAEWAVGIIAAIGIAGVLIAVVTNGAVQEALLRFVLQVIHSFSGFMVKH